MPGPDTDPPESTDIAIVGAGAAGLAAAIFTRRSIPSRSVLLLDGAARPGAKILVSGGSRCNVTNATVTERDFCGGKSTIVRRVLRGLPVPDTIAWFRELGVPLHEEAHGKLFPDTNRSRDVLEALLREANAAGAAIRSATRVHTVSRTAAGFSLETSRGPIHARRVVLATGGQSLPKTGSDGAGLEIARALGHTIVPTTPALVPLTLAPDEVLHAQLPGVAQEVELSVWVNGAIGRRDRGALLWTHFGVSGPVVLDVSRHWLRALLEGHQARMTISFLPDERFETLDARWTSIASTRPRTSVSSALSGLLPVSVARALLDRLRIDGTVSLADFPRANRRRLTHALVASPLPITGSRGYSYAEATAGGVRLDEVDPSTMESRRTAGLYLVGEMLDVDGRLGGFNFQWAWSSAKVAANALAARS
ncbi:MAG: NAD(P)/FAD-dependent oxidoreductase [Acidobacteriota bacterium]